MIPSASSADLLPLPADNAVIIFRTERSGVHGRLVRLGAVAEKVIRTHGLPDGPSHALGEAVALAALLGSALPGEGSISVQSKTDGLIPVLYADCQAPGRLRGYVRFNPDLLVEGEPQRSSTTKLGHGHLAITIETGIGSGAERYQGVIALDDVSLSTAAAAYFEQRESLPTFVRLAVAQHYAGADAGLPSKMKWRAGGIMMQQVTPTADANGADTDGWNRVRMLTATIEDHELLDPALSPEQLLLRLFHEEGVVVERVVPAATYCKCSRDKVLGVLTSFGPGELSDMRDSTGKIAVKCEFCATNYAFDPSEIGAAP